MYLDETRINSHAAPERIWVDEDGMDGWKRSSRKGERLIIVHAGTACTINGSPNAAKGSSQKQNLLSMMNAQHFLE